MRQTTLADVIRREPVVPWSGAARIPWHEPGFSARMLREHLSQQHDRASRRLALVDRHVAWIHRAVCGGRRARILDLGCGPGLYTARLARRGHQCVGIDFSPASIDHARAEAEGEALPCTYLLENLRTAELGTGFAVALLLSGELDTFPPADARTILERARRALAPGGRLVLEVHEESFVRALGEAAPTWFTAERSVFSDEPHLCLRESSWHTEERVATERFFVVSGSRDVAAYTSTTQARADHELSALLGEAGFPHLERHGSLTGGATEEPATFRVVVASPGPAS